MQVRETPACFGEGTLVLTGPGCPGWLSPLGLIRACLFCSVDGRCDYHSPLEPSPYSQRGTSVMGRERGLFLPSRSWLQGRLVEGVDVEVTEERRAKFPGPRTDTWAAEGFVKSFRSHLCLQHNKKCKFYRNTFIQSGSLTTVHCTFLLFLSLYLHAFINGYSL